VEPSGHQEPVMGLIYLLPGNFSAGLKQPGRAAYDLPLSNIESRNTWSHTSTPPYAYTVCTLKISHLPLQAHNTKSWPCLCWHAILQIQKKNLSIWNKDNISA